MSKAGILLCEGYWIEGKRHGLVKEFLTDKVYTESEYVMGIMEGSKTIYGDGWIFKG